MLPPGGEGEVEVTLTPKGNQEEIVKRIIVVSNDPKQPKFTLTMKGKLLVDARADPMSVIFKDVKPGEPASANFSVQITDPSKTTITSVVVEDAENFEVRPLEAEAEGQLRYEVRFRGSKTVGNFGSRVEVTTTGANTPQLNIPVRATVASNLRYSKRLHFTQRDGKWVERQLRISTKDGTPPKIEKIKDPDGLLVLEMGEPNGATVTIVARVDEAKAGALAEPERGKSRTLTLHTNDPDEPRVEITYTIGGARGPVRAPQ